MSLLQVPYPKASLPKYAQVLAAIAFSVVFILVVFQPFGTRTFVHSYKEVLLAGYGVVIFICGIAYYFVTDRLIPGRIKDRWSVVHEVVFVFSSVMVSLLGCYLYWSVNFRGSLSMHELGYFSAYAASVAVVPVSVYLLFIYQKYKEVAYSVAIEPTATSEGKLTVYGTNKNEQISLDSKSLLYVKSSDNYVILHILVDDLVTKKMLRNTLSKVSDQLSDEFLKVHRQYLVNKRHILDMQGNITNSMLILKGSYSHIPVSRKMVPVLREIL